MLQTIGTSSASASHAPVSMRASAAADVSASQAHATAAATAASARAQQTGALNAEQTFRYNTFEFVYRQDIGRIVLVGQSPETGERVVQVPSEQALRAYEHTVRVERQMVRIRKNQSSEQSPKPEATPQSVPQLAKALVAAVNGDNHGSGVVSVSA